MVKKIVPVMLSIALCSFASSCNFNANIPNTLGLKAPTIYEAKKESNGTYAFDFSKVNGGKKTGFNVNLQVKLDNAFQTKSAALKRVKSADVLSFNVGLTTDPSNPIPAPGTVVVSLNKSGGTNVPVQFRGVPGGATYYAFVSVFDKVISDSTRENISEENKNLFQLTSPNNKVYISSNAVTVSPDLLLDTFSPLSVNVKLRPPRPSNTDYLAIEIDPVGSRYNPKVEVNEVGNGLIVWEELGADRKSVV